MPSGVETLKQIAERQLGAAQNETRKSVVLTDFVLRAREILRRNTALGEEEKVQGYAGIRERLQEICRVHKVDGSRAEALLPPANDRDRRKPAHFKSDEPDTMTRRLAVKIDYQGDCPSFKELDKLQRLLAREMRGKCPSEAVVTAVKAMNEKYPGFLQYAVRCEHGQIRSLFTCLRARYSEIDQLIVEEGEEAVGYQ